MRQLISSVFCIYIILVCTSPSISYAQGEFLDILQRPVQNYEKISESLSNFSFEGNALRIYSNPNTQQLSIVGHGYTPGESIMNLWVATANVQGKFLSNSRLHSIYSQWFNGAVLHSNGLLYITGTEERPTETHAHSFIMAVNPKDGAIKFTHYYPPGSHISTVSILDSQNVFYIVDFQSEYHSYILKPDGNIINKVALSGMENLTITDFCLDGKGGVAFIGTIDENKLCYGRLNEIGEKIFLQRYSISVEDIPVRILPSGNGNFYITSQTKFKQTGVSYAEWYFLINPYGDIIWSKYNRYFSTPSHVKDACVIGGNQILLAGKSMNNNISSPLLHLYDINSNEVWALPKQLNTPEYESTYDAVCAIDKFTFVTAGAYLYKPTNKLRVQLTVFKGREIASHEDILKTHQGTLTDFIAKNDGYWMCGNSLKEGQTQGWVSEWDQNNNLKKSFFVGGIRDEYLQSIIEINNKLYVVGESWSFTQGKSDAWIACLSTSGELLWQKNFGGKGLDRFNKIAKQEKTFLVAGESQNEADGYTRAFWYLFDADGNVKKSYQIPDSLNSTWYDILADDKGGYYLTGKIQEALGDKTDGLIQYISAEGEVQWEKTYGSSKNDEIYKLAFDEGVLYTAGYSESYGKLNTEGIWLCKMNQEGEILKDTVIFTFFTLNISSFTKKNDQWYIVGNSFQSSETADSKFFCLQLLETFEEFNTIELKNPPFATINISIPNKEGVWLMGGIWSEYDTIPFGEYPYRIYLPTKELKQ